jgi:hypothetical protein
MMKGVLEEFKKNLENGDMEHAMNSYLVMKENKYSVKLNSTEKDKNKNAPNNISCLEYSARPKVKVSLSIMPKKLQVKEELLHLLEDDNEDYFLVMREEIEEIEKNEKIYSKSKSCDINIDSNKIKEKISNLLAKPDLPILLRSRLSVGFPY